MEDEKKFRTKTGYCHILSDQLVLSRDGVVGHLAQMTVGNGMTRIFLIYGALSALLLFFAFLSYQNGETMWAILEAAMALFLLNAILLSRNNSATPIIERSKIKSMKLNKGIRGLTRARFVVKFVSESGKIKTRIIMLPGSLSEGITETEKAIKLLNEENLLTS